MTVMMQPHADRRGKGRARTSVLITGFGPFPGVPSNATMQLLPQLAQVAPKSFPDVHFAFEVLPTEWRQRTEGRDEAGRDEAGHDAAPCCFRGGSRLAHEVSQMVRSDRQSRETRPSDEIRTIGARRAPRESPNAPRRD